MSLVNLSQSMASWEGENNYVADLLDEMGGGGVLLDEVATLSPLGLMRAFAANAAAAAAAAIAALDPP